MQVDSSPQRVGRTASIQGDEMLFGSHELMQEAGGGIGASQNSPHTAFRGQTQHCAREMML